MINADMRTYSYFTFGAVNAYGQETLSAQPQGTIKMAINILSQNTADNIRYSEATYVGLTTDNAVNDRYVIQYGDERLKVLYVNPRGRFTQVFLSVYDRHHTQTLDGGVL